MAKFVPVEPIYDIYKITYRRGRQICEYIKSEEYETNAKAYCDERNARALKYGRLEQFRYDGYFE